MWSTVLFFFVERSNNTTSAGNVLPSDSIIPFARRFNISSVSTPVTATSYVFGKCEDGCIIAFAKSPSFVKSKIPEVS